MSDLAALHNRIASLAAPRIVASEGREILAAFGCDPHDAFLKEISETRFLRRLTFRNERAERLICIAVSGRVLCLPEPDFEDLPDLADAEEDQTTALQERINTFLSGATSLNVVSDRPPQDEYQGRIGLALSRHFFELSAMENRQCDTSGFQLESFATKLSAIASAFVRVDLGQISQATGQDRQLAPLLALAKEEIKAKGQPAVGPTKQHFVLLSTGRASEASNGQAAICAAIDKTVLFAAFPAALMDQTLQDWARCRSVVG